MSHFIYCLTFPETGICKIGHTHSLTTRIQSLKTAFGTACFRSIVIETDKELCKDLERAIKLEFKNERLSKEIIEKQVFSLACLQGTKECFDISYRRELTSRLLHYYLESNQPIDVLTLGSCLAESKSQIIEQIIELKTCLRAALRIINKITKFY